MSRDGAAEAMPEADGALVARRLVTELVAGGVGHVVLSPGSRSAPLAYALLAAAEEDWLELHVQLDERVAGFVALGLARAADEPVAVVTTSGTAVANLHPAVLEASHAGVPLVVVSADRPHELRRTGANQTTEQVGIFADACRWQADVPAGAPAGDEPGQVVVRALAAARGVRSAAPGPVHLNVAFRDPLVPHRAWRPGQAPGRRVHVTTARGGEPHVLRRGPRTVVVAGDGAGPDAAHLARQGGWPLLAEPSAGVSVPGATGPGGGAGTPVPAGAVLLEVLGPDAQRAVVFGHPTLTRAVGALLARGDIEVVLVAPTGEVWPDPAGRVTVITHAVRLEEDGTDDNLADQHAAARAAADEAWSARWQRAGSAARDVLDRHVASNDDALAAAAAVTAATTTGQAIPATLVIGSSMAVREVDLLAPVWPPGLRVLANRGLAGIDGTLATAVGLALGGAGPVRALVGDLTFLHDAGALLRGTLEQDVDLQVVVLNDTGGTIFATLEHGRALSGPAFDRVFGTPQTVNIPALAAAYGAAARTVRGPAELGRVLVEPIRGRSVIEVRIDRADLAGARGRLAAQLREAAHDALGRAHPPRLDSQETPR